MWGSCVVEKNFVLCLLGVLLTSEASLSSCFLRWNFNAALIIRMAPALISCCCASVLEMVYAGLLVQYNKQHMVTIVTIVSVNIMSDKMPLDLKGNLAKVCAYFFSSPPAVGFIAKSTLPYSGITLRRWSQQKPRAFIGCHSPRRSWIQQQQGHRGMAQDKSLILGCYCEEPPPHVTRTEKHCGEVNALFHWQNHTAALMWISKCIVKLNADIILTSHIILLITEH